MGRIQIDNAGNASTALDFDPKEFAPEQICYIYASFVLRLISNLAGNWDARVIATNCRKGNSIIIAEHSKNSLDTTPSVGKVKSFTFECVLVADKNPRFKFGAHGFGFLAKGVGEAAKLAVSDFRFQLIDCGANEVFLRMLELVSYEIGGYGSSGLVKMNNQSELASCAIVAAREEMNDG